MSVEAMSAAIKSRITSRLKEVILKDGTDLTERKLKNFSEYTSREQIRSDTDTVLGRHESIMSRQAFSSLLTDMSSAIAKKELSDELSVAVATASFDGFVSYISEEYYKDKEFLLSDNRRVKNGFIYSGPTRKTTESVAVYAKSEDRSEDYRDVLILKNIPQGKLVTYYVEYIAKNSPGLHASAKAGLKKSLQGGHLTGVFTARLIRAFGLTKDTAGDVKLIKNTNLTDLEKQLAMVVDLVTAADYLSSNVVLDIDLFTETDKRLYENAAEIRLTTEVQFAGTNKAAGDMLTTAGAYLSKLINSVKPGTSAAGQDELARIAFTKMLENLKKVSQYVKDRAIFLKKLEASGKLNPSVQKKLEQIISNQETFNTLITTEGSPSILQHITSIVALGIQGKTAKKSASKAKVKDSIRPRKVGKPSVKQATKVKNKSINFKQPVLKLATSPVSTVSLTALQSLINANLAEKIKENMGDGSSRNVLNNRTGRLAESAQVERMSESRAGMITAFYSYMKNPYATFSAGGRQQDPKSRDPKLLIAKSIREIAAQQVGNRLRSVLI